MKIEKVTRGTILRLIEKNNFEFRSTQSKLCIPIINRLYLKMSIGVKFSGIKIFEDKIIDGHHRYIASLLAQIDLDKISSNATSATSVTSWGAIQLVEEDWDTKAKIDMMNENDAIYNDMPLHQIVELLK